MCASWIGGGCSRCFQSAFFAEFGGGEACLAAEIAAEGGLVVESQQVGDGLHREVVPYVE